VSYLGTLAERSGDYAEALLQFREHTRRCEAIVRDNPRNPRWEERLANAFGFEATVLEITGQRAAALERRRQARELAAAVAQRDPANRTWQRAALGPVLKEAMLVRALGDEASARALVSEARAGYEALHKAEPTNRVVAGSLMAACRLEAQLNTATGRPGAAEAVTRALAIGEGLIAKIRANDTQLGEFLHACVVAGQIAWSRGDNATALRHWQRAVEVARPRIAGSSNWRLLDPAARAFALLGRVEESRALTERLQQAGYQPIDRWPEIVSPNR
jgi:tetratricopeptide (TPR) repeat protein